MVKPKKCETVGNLLDTLSKLPRDLRVMMLVTDSNDTELSEAVWVKLYGMGVRGDEFVTLEPE